MIAGINQYHPVYNGFYLFFWSSRLLGCNIVSKTSPSNQRKSPLGTHHPHLVVRNRLIFRSEHGRRVQIFILAGSYVGKRRINLLLPGLHAPHDIQDPPLTPVVQPKLFQLLHRLL